MNITSDDPRLTALALNELPTEEAVRLRAEIESSTELSSAYEQTLSLVGFLKECHGAAPLSLGEERHEQIFQTGKRPDGEVLMMQNRKRSRRHAVRVFIGAAAVIALGVFLLTHTRVETPGLASEDGSGVNRVNGEAETGGANQAVASGGEVSYPLGSRTVITQPTIFLLPIEFPEFQAEKTRRWLYKEKKALPRELNATLSWINTVSPHQEPQLVFEDLALATEVGACPWDDRKNLLLVRLNSLREEEKSVHWVKGELEVMPERVKSIQLLSEGTRSDSERQAVSFAAGASRFLLYEIEFVPGADRLGALHLEVILQSGQEKSAYLPINAGAKSAPSRDFKMVTLMAAFTRWNQGGGSSEELAEISKDARTLYSTVTDPLTREALDLILLTKDLVTH